ncbi:Bgt-55013 [Blumeria graminis f. sp. tritici]|uniref:Bgt-55013 n=1 Tax=Blumeria graminis f. sp. tritici TaxID=62690 RepID=A0A9X9MFK3_BLUGR|nr:Bgt-55013 [Blumeria graminis f. sp. tritici]
MQRRDTFSTGVKFRILLRVLRIELYNGRCCDPPTGGVLSIL